MMPSPLCDRFHLENGCIHRRSFKESYTAKEMLNSCYRETGNGCAESYGRLVSPYVAIGCLIIRY